MSWQGGEHWRHGSRSTGIQGTSIFWRWRMFGCACTDVSGCTHQIRWDPMQKCPKLGSYASRPACWRHRSFRPPFHPCFQPTFHPFLCPCASRTLLQRWRVMNPPKLHRRDHSPMSHRRHHSPKSYWRHPSKLHRCHESILQSCTDALSNVARTSSLSKVAQTPPSKAS
jgi:hypothetical protein